MILSAPQQSVADTCYAELKKLGWEHVQRCGLLAMAVGESSLDSDAKGDKDHSFGLWQIQAGRENAIRRATGVDVATAPPADQCRAVDWELRNPEKKAGDALRQAITTDEAVAVLVNMYERPANRQAAITKRKVYGEWFDAHYGAKA